MNQKSVPQTAPEPGHMYQQEFNFNLVKLEPELQAIAGAMKPGERRALAKVYLRWSHELEVSANVIEHHALSKPWRRRRVPRIAPSRLVLN
jgi:hypothetical protein